MKGTLKHKNDNENNFINLKTQYILKEYQSYFDMNPIHLSRISYLHSWEITLFSGLLLFLIAGKLHVCLVEDILVKDILALIVMMFLLLECGIHSTMARLSEDIENIEKKLCEKEQDKFINNILEWNFGWLRKHRWTLGEKLSYAIKSIVTPSIFIWHGALLLIVICLFFFWS